MSKAGDIVGGIFVGLMLGFLIGCAVSDLVFADGRIQQAGGVLRCWKKVNGVTDCRLTCPGFNPFQAEEVKP